MKYIFSILVYALSIIITLYIFPMSISYSRVSDTIEIKTLLTKSDHMVTSLNFQKTNITFGKENKICPNNKCFYKFEKASLDDGFGAKNSKFLSGTLKIKQILKIILLHINSIKYRVCLIWLIGKKILQLEKKFWCMKVIYYLTPVTKCLVHQN